MSGQPSGSGQAPVAFTGGGAGAGPSANAMAMRHQQVQMWAQEHNMIDSGIHSSGNNSAAPSVMSGATSLHEALINQPATSVPYGMPAPSSSAYPPGVYPPVGQITPNHLRNLIEFMSDSDPVVVENAVNLVVEICRGGPQQLSSLCNNAELMRTLADIGKRMDRPVLIKYVASAFYQMSTQVDGVVALQQHVIATLVRLLSFGLSTSDNTSVDPESRTSETVRHYALSTVHNLLQHANHHRTGVGSVPSAKEEMVRFDAHRVVLNMLTMDQQDKVLAVLVDCLHHFVTGSSDVRHAILTCGGTAALVQIMKEREYEKLLWITSRLLVRLSSHADHKATIIRLGGVQALGRHLAHASARLVNKCMQNLLNLSDEATQEPNVDELLRHVVRLLGTTDRVLEAYCVGTLMNLTCNNQQNKRTIVEEKGVTALVRTLQLHCGTEAGADIVESGLRALRHLVSRHELAARAQADLRSADGFQLLADLLESRQPVAIRWTLDLIANIAANDEHVRALAEQPSRVPPGRLVLVIVIGALDQAFVHIQQFGERSCVGSTRVVNLAACTVFALQRLARYPEARNFVVNQQPNVMQTLVHMLAFETESLLRLVLGALVELLQEPQGLVALRHHQPLSLLNDLAHSSNAEIAKLSRQLVEQLSGPMGPSEATSSGTMAPGAGLDWCGDVFGSGNVPADDHDADMQLSDVLSGVATAGSMAGDLTSPLDTTPTPSSSSMAQCAPFEWPGAPQPSPATGFTPQQQQWTDM